jgi:hypothetical protein
MRARDLHIQVRYCDALSGHSVLYFAIIPDIYTHRDQTDWLASGRGPESEQPW